MDTSLSRLYGLYESSEGRRIYAFNQVAAVAKEMGVDELLSFLPGAIKHERETLKLDARWRRDRLERAPRFGAEAVKLDNSIDTNLGSMDRILRARVSAEPREIAESIDEIHSQLFPGGVSASIRGRMDLRCAHPVVEITDIDLGSVPGFITSGIETGIEKALNEALVDVDLRHRYNLDFREGFARVNGQPR